MGKLTEHLTEHLLEVLWAFFIICLILAGLSVIFGRSVGYEFTILISLGFSLVVAAIFAVIVAGNLVWIALVRLRTYLSARHGSPEIKRNENLK